MCSMSFCASCSSFHRHPTHNDKVLLILETWLSDASLKLDFYNKSRLIKKLGIVLNFTFENESTTLLKDTLWVLKRDEPLVHIFVDILLITKHVLDHDVSLES